MPEGLARPAREHGPAAVAGALAAAAALVDPMLGLVAALAEPATEEGLRRALAVRRARAQEYTTDVAAAGGVSLEELGQRLAAVEDFQDLYLRGGARALEVSDRDYRRHLAQVVAGGLQDDVPLDRTALLLDLLHRSTPSTSWCCARSPALQPQASRSTTTSGALTSSKSPPRPGRT